ncbi:hypothetical protein DL765_000579 [Monosporascus sp. GIB2]|nr:hypothetical protein DL765_000579 [Monosporascus sp. GIB2]
MILGIFYARFLPQEGTKIVAQSPPGCIVASPDAPNSKPPLLDFDIIQEYIIPRKAFFNRFITVNSPDGKYSILGFPVSIPNERYHRNEFLFNFGLVVESDVDQIPYERLVRRLAITFAEMERQNGYLSSEGTAKAAEDGRRPIESLLEIIKEDLNNYGECMIPIGKGTFSFFLFSAPPIPPTFTLSPFTPSISHPSLTSWLFPKQYTDEANTLNMKLFPYHAPPPPVRGWHVPVPKMKLADIVDPTWDLTLQKIIPYIDGVNDVRRVAWLADVSLPLAQIALQHLLYYDTILLLDMFFFGSCYAPRPGIHDFVANRDGLVDECAGYVCLHPPHTRSSVTIGEAPVVEQHHPDSARNQSRSTTSGSASEPRKPSTSSSGSGGRVKDDPSKAESHRTSPTARSGAGSGSRAPTPAPATNSGATTTGPVRVQVTAVTHYQLIKLMTTFCVGRSVMEWIKLHQDAGFDVLRHVDVRRLVQFGVIKGLLYRVHKYVVSKRYLQQLATGQARAWRDSNSDDNNNNNRKNGDGNGRRDEAGGAANSGGDNNSNNPLCKYMDGTHCFDQIITEQNMTDAEIMEKLKSFRAPAGDLTVFYR